jgi:hypothetical protein
MTEPRVDDRDVTAEEPAEAVGLYMHGAYLETEGPYYCVRGTGVGENIVRCGDLVAAVLANTFTHPNGPMYLSAARIAALTPIERRQLEARGVQEIIEIPVTEVRAGDLVTDLIRRVA